MILPEPNKYDLPPINLFNFWMYNFYIRKLDDETIYKEYIEWKIEEFYKSKKGS